LADGPNRIKGWWDGSCRAPDEPPKNAIVTPLVSPIRRVLADERSWLALFCITAVVATAVCVARVCNNFLIFRAAYDHLLAGADMYARHPGEHVDLFKYSPTFALVFAPFRALPYAPALLVWNLLNVLLIYAGLRFVLEPAERLAAVQLTAIGLVTTLDGTQSNGLVGATILLAFAALERKRLGLAAVAIASGIMIKIFPAAALALAAPRRDRAKFGLLFAGIFAVMVAAPLMVTALPTLIDQYRSWYAMGSADALDRGASVMRLLHVIFGYDGANWPVQLAGTLVLLLPLARGQWSDARHRKLFLASLLVYSVIFNHKAEQPSFVIALVGVAVWYALRPRSLVRDVLAGSVIVATVPMFLAVAIPWLPGGIVPALLMTCAACTAVWIGIQAELLELVPEAAESLAVPLMQPAD
jgi:hypothetical protein